VGGGSSDHRRPDAGQRTPRKRLGLTEAIWVGVLALAGVGIALATPPIQSTKTNFFSPGTQPFEAASPNFDPLYEPNFCAGCHGYYDQNSEPFYRWNHSMMGQATRDPVFYAELSITEQDASYVGELCLRCHAPMAWLQNKVKFDDDPASPTHGNSLALHSEDKLGVACHVCHRMVDPVYQPGVSPAPDQAILAGLATGVPLTPHNADFTIDPQDRRRGPFDLAADWSQPPRMGWPGFHMFLQSPFHLSSRLCATCHDVSSAHYTRQANGSYSLNAPGQAPAASKYDQFPEQRTYSEWSQSLFASGPVNLGGHFCGASQSYSSCQDCHMQTTTGQGCALDPPVRTNLPQHNFNGANTWVLSAVRALYPDSDTNLDAQGVTDSISRATAMLQAAADLQPTQLHAFVNARIVNYTGHKLPTGYNEGRRMWLNLKFRSATGQFLAERGAYDTITATLTTANTKVYEAVIGPDAAVAAQVGVPAAGTFRLALSNKFYKDNRIPPAGFLNATFTDAQAGHVPPNQYADGQYWDDTRFAIPSGARSVDVTLYYQTSSK